MNTRFQSSSRAVLFALGLIGAGGLGWAAASNADNPSVTVKVDERPVADSNSPLGASYAPIVKRVAPSVVKVMVTERAQAASAADVHPFFNHPGFREFFGDQFGRNFEAPNRRGALRRPPQEGLGSGVIVSADGYILTNSHVVRGADTIKVTLGDGQELNAKVVGTDPQTDLAVIKVDQKDLPAITFADSDRVEVGDRVLAVGNPFGIGQTVTSGMVSGLGRAMLGLDYEDFIQTDAAINPGNSGGALVDAQGRLIGINTAILSRSGGFQGIGFAIPANLARNVMQQLATTGKVVRGYLGVTIQDISSELAEHFDLPNRTGALIAEVMPESPAEKAGLKGGDVVTKIEGKEIRDARNLKLTVGTLKPGETVSAEVLRDGKPIEVELTVTARPNDRSLAGPGGGMDEFGGPGEDTGTLNGVGVADLDPQARREFDIPRNVRGALITSVEPDSAAAQVGLQAGDVILEINRKPVRNAEDAIRLTERTESKKTLVRVWTARGGIRYVVVDETETDTDE